MSRGFPSMSWGFSPSLNTKTAKRLLNFCVERSAINRKDLNQLARVEQYLEICVGCWREPALETC